MKGASESHKILLSKNVPGVTSSQHVPNCTQETAYLRRMLEPSPVGVASAALGLLASWSRLAQTQLKVSV